MIVKVSDIILGGARCLHLAISTYHVLHASQPTTLSRFQQNCIFDNSFLLF